MGSIGRVIGNGLATVLGFGLAGAGCLIQLAVLGVAAVLGLAILGWVFGLFFGSDQSVDAERFTAYVIELGRIETTHDRIQSDVVQLASPVLASSRSGSDELQRLSELYGNGLNALRANRSDAAQLEPEPIQTEVHELALRVLDADIAVFERILDLVSIGLSETRAGRAWRFPDDPQVERLLADSQSLRAQLNRAKDRTEAAARE